MSTFKQLSYDFLVGGQPSRGTLARLREKIGMQSVVNLRTSQEIEDALSPVQEGEACSELGLDYFHLPVSMDEMSHELVHTFREKVKNLHKPIYVHCASGMRAGAFVMMHLAVENDWSARECFTKAEEQGFECDKPEMKAFLKAFIEENQRAGSAV